MNKTLSYVLIALLAGLAGYLYGENTALKRFLTEQIAANHFQVEPPQEGSKQLTEATPATSVQKVAQKPSQEVQPKPEVKPLATAVKPEVAEEKIAPTPDPRPAPQALPEVSNCIEDEKEWSLQLTLYSEQLEKQRIPYTQSPASALQDCSGIFHRIVQFAQSKCDRNLYPTPEKVRDSRSIARWYHEQGNMVIVQDAKASRNLIKPGSVMFFGRNGQRYSNITIEDMTGNAKKGIRGAIEHIGVVTEVHKDENGDVIGYVMMHGRRPGKHAQRSHYHKIEPPRLGYPVLGNWNQQWIGISNIMTPKSDGPALAAK
ncbi:MAG: hypothetical protein AAFR61_00185 [Bacteroidota bacterium]